MSTTSSSIAAAPVNGMPALIVLGRDDRGKPHAAWFGEPDAALADKAAGMMGMAALQTGSDELRGLAGQLPHGRVFASGRAFVPFVKATMFDRLASHLPDGFAWPTRPVKAVSDHDAPTGGDDPKGDGPAGGGDGGAGGNSADAPPSAWAKIVVGDVVLATDGEGWFETHVIKANLNGLFTLKWRDWTDLPAFTRRREDLGLLHPSHAA